MYAFVLFLVPALSYCVTVTYNQAQPISKSKVELTPMLITCALNDIAIISAPAVDTDSAIYLNKPNGDVIKLDVPRSINLKDTDKNQKVDKYASIATINNEINEDSLHPSVSFRVFHPSYRNGSLDVMKEKEWHKKRNEFMIGPLLQEDHGNWVLSVYLNDIDDNWLEFFQVISVEIVERTPVVIKRPQLRAGDTFHLSFAYPIPNLQSCELVAPNTTYDRHFDRNRDLLIDRCEYVVENVTTEDGGIWKIVGVGNIVYVGQANLTVQRA